MVRLLAWLAPCCIFLSVLHDLDDALHILWLVVRLVTNLGIGQYAVIPQSLQGSWLDSKNLAHVLIVQPLPKTLVRAAITHLLHLLDEVIELCFEALKGFFLDVDYFHMYAIYLVYNSSLSGSIPNRRQRYGKCTIWDSSVKTVSVFNVSRTS